MVRILRPNSRTGVIQPVAPALQAGGPTTAYNRPSSALRRLNNLLDGASPEIVVSRQTGGIGDVLMTLPTVRAVRQKYGGPVTYATDFDYLQGSLPMVLEHNPDIKEVVPWRKINSERYDAVVDLTCPCVSHEQPKAPPINRIDLFARHAGVFLESAHIPYTVTNEERAWAKKELLRLRISSKKIILVQPCSSSSNRDIPLETLQEALGQILDTDSNLRAVILTHQTDNYRTNWDLPSMYPMPDLTIREIAAIMERAKLTICQDSAILHLAGAIGARTVALFGPTDPRARVNYYPNAVGIWPGGELSCAPSWYAKPNCGRLCWKMVSPEMISEPSLQIIRNEPLKSADYIYTYPDTKMSHHSSSINCDEL